MNAVLLRFLDVFRGFFGWLGVNYTQLRAIVGIKLTMDNRRQVMSYHRRGNNSDPANTFLWTLFLYSIFGAFVAFALAGVPSFILSMTLFFSYIMVMIAMTLITDFSSILLDASDNTIILPRPVDSRTLFIARVTHILLYVGQITIGLALFPAVAVLFKYGFALLMLFIIATVLSVMTAVFITNSFYLLILRFSSEEKLKNVINYFQIALAVFIMGGYQLLPRLAGNFELEGYVFEIAWWCYLAPPVWMGAALEMYHLVIIDTPHLLLTACALLMPVTGFYFVNRYLTPVFTRKLSLMSVQSNEKRPTQQRQGFSSSISGFLTSTKAERGAFELAGYMLLRDRKIKLKVYPAFGYIIVFAMIFMFRSRDDLSATWQNLPETNYHVMLLYLAFMILQVALFEIPYSDDFKASWIYRSAPVQQPGLILSGAAKAVFAFLFMPAFTVISIAVLGIWGIGAIDDIAFGFFNNMLILLCIMLANKRFLPFSMETSLRNQSGSFIRSMIMIVLVMVLGFAHYLLTAHTLWLVGAIPLQIALVYALLGQYQRTAWSKITL